MESHESAFKQGRGEQTDPRALPSHPSQNRNEVAIFLLALCATAIAVYLFAHFGWETAALHAIWIGPIICAPILLAIFARERCPLCRADLRQTGSAEIEGEKWNIFHCERCQRAWRIEDKESRM